jgi:hypothetical protein
MAKDVRNTRRLWDIRFSPGKRNRPTKPGTFKHQLNPKKARKTQNALMTRCRRLHQAKGATNKVAKTPV